MHNCFVNLLESNHKLTSKSVVKLGSGFQFVHRWTQDGLGSKSFASQLLLNVLSHVDRVQLKSTIKVQRVMYCSQKVGEKQLHRSRARLSWCKKKGNKNLKRTIHLFGLPGLVVFTQILDTFVSGDRDAHGVLYCLIICRLLLLPAFDFGVSKRSYTLAQKNDVNKWDTNTILGSWGWQYIEKWKFWLKKERNICLC